MKQAKISLGKIQHEALFWGHFVLWLFAIISPFIFSLRWLVAGFALYVAHLLIFRGCIVTRLQRRHGQVEAEDEYYQALIERVTHYRLSARATFVLARSVELYVLIAALLLNR